MDANPHHDVAIYEVLTLRHRPAPPQCDEIIKAIVSGPRTNWRNGLLKRA